MSAGRESTRSQFHAFLLMLSLSLFWLVQISSFRFFSFTCRAQQTPLTAQPTPKRTSTISNYKFRRNSQGLIEDSGSSLGDARLRSPTTIHRTTFWTGFLKALNTLHRWWLMTFCSWVELSWAEWTTTMAMKSKARRSSKTLLCRVLVTAFILLQAMI